MATLGLVLVCILSSSQVLAYRPFQGTDAAVAEFGPAEPMRAGPLTTAEMVSALAGAIWQVNDKLAFDIALRDARVNGHTVAGVTFGRPLW